MNWSTSPRSALRETHPISAGRACETSYCNAKNSSLWWINQYIPPRRGTPPGEAAVLSFLAKKQQLINQEYVEIKPHIKPVRSVRLQWQWFTTGWAKLLTVRSCNGCQCLLLISVAGDRYCCCYFLPRRFHWCLPRYPTVLYLNHMGAKWCN